MSLWVIYFPTNWGARLSPRNLPKHRGVLTFFENFMTKQKNGEGERWVDGWMESLGYSSLDENEVYWQ